MWQERGNIEHGRQKWCSKHRPSQVQFIILVVLCFVWFRLLITVLIIKLLKPKVRCSTYNYYLDFKGICILFSQVWYYRLMLYVVWLTLYAFFSFCNHLGHSRLGHSMGESGVGSSALSQKLPAAFSLNSLGYFLSVSPGHASAVLWLTLSSTLGFIFVQLVCMNEWIKHI